MFQDAGESINPRFTAWDAIADPLRQLMHLSGAKLDAAVREAARLCGLPEPLLARFPHQLSGGQRARVGIARAVGPRPDLMILDEPTAALDVSVQVTILKLLAELRQRLGMSYVFVSHDLNVVRLLCDRVAVMYLGRIVETGPAEAVFRAPRHPYTRALIAAAPHLDGVRRPVPAAAGGAAQPDRPLADAMRLLRPLPCRGAGLQRGPPRPARHGPGLVGRLPLRGARLMDVNDPAVLAEVTAAFRRYDDALMANDVDVLVELFWDSPHTIRYGGGENLYGIGEIAAFRAGRSPMGLARTLDRTVITTFGRDFATASTLFHRSPGSIGRQMQSWVRMPEGWRIVAASVSVIPDP